MNITLSQQAKPSDDVLFQEVGGEAVLLNLASLLALRRLARGLQKETFPIQTEAS